MKHAKVRTIALDYLGSPEGLATLILTKLRSENSANKKTLKQAWRFFLLHYLFVSPEGFEPSTASLEGRCSIQLS